MDTTNGMLSVYLSITNTIVSILGLIILVVTLVLTARSIRKSVEESTYGVWRQVYDRLAETPQGTSFFGLELDQAVDLKMLSMFLMILDMYAHRYSDNYSKISSENTLLVSIMKSKVSREYWKICRKHFFEDPRFIAEIDKLAQTT